MDKSWHIWNFPDNLYVLIEENVRNEFFEEMYNIFGSQKSLATFLKMDRTSIQCYHYGRAWYKNKIAKRFLPIKILKSLKLYIKPQLRKKIENSVLEIRGKGGNGIEYPILPIKESPQFYRVVANMLGDGNDSHTPYYANTCKELRERFKKDLQMFGKIRYYETKKK